MVSELWGQTGWRLRAPKVFPGTNAKTANGPTGVHPGEIRGLIGDRVPRSQAVNGRDQRDQAAY